MASEGQGCDYGARLQSTPINEQNPLDNIWASLLATHRMSQFKATVERSGVGGEVLPYHPCLPRRQPHPLWLPWTRLDKHQQLGPLGQQSRHDSGDIPTCGRSLPGPRAHQEDWPWVAAVRAKSLPAVRIRGPHNQLLLATVLVLVRLSRGGPQRKAGDPGPPRQLGAQGNPHPASWQIAKLTILLRELFNT